MSSKESAVPLRFAQMFQIRQHWNRVLQLVASIRNGLKTFWLCQKRAVHACKQASIIIFWGGAFFASLTNCFWFSLSCFSSSVSSLTSGCFFSFWFFLSCRYDRKRNKSTHWSVQWLPGDYRPFSFLTLAVLLALLAPRAFDPVSFSTFLSFLSFLCFRCLVDDELEESSSSTALKSLSISSEVSVSVASSIRTKYSRNSWWNEIVLSDEQSSSHNQSTIAVRRKR